MKPLKLKMKGFGAYKSETEIDFEKLSNSSVFLITGPTGAGKTTILDAVTYTLFGKSSSLYRDKNDMISDFSSPKEDSYVEFEFSLRSGVYGVKRYLRSSKSENSVSLWKKEGGEKKFFNYKKGKDFDEEIKKIMGLNAEQFTQIMILPQNQFQKFLFSDSNQKEEILKKLFRTEIYEKIEEKLKEKLREITQKTQETRSKIETVLQASSSADLEEIKAKREVQIKEKGKIQKDASVLGAKLKKAEEDYRKALETFKNFEEYEKTESEFYKMNSVKKEYDKKKEILNRALEAQKISDVSERFLNAEKEVSDKEEEIEEIKKRFQVSGKNKDSALKEYQGIDKLKEKKKEADSSISYMEKQISKIEELKDLKDKIKKTDLEILKISNELNEAINRKDKLKTDIEKRERRKKEIAKSQTEYEKLKKTYEEYMELSEKKQVFGKLKTEFKEIDEELEKKKDEERKLQSEFEKIKLEREEAAKNLEKSVVSNLALSLKEGSPCPVCGSTHHPLKAKLEGNKKIDVSLFEIDKKMDEISKKLSSVGKEISELDKTKSKIEAKLETLKEFVEKIKKEEFSQIELKLKKAKENAEEFESLEKETEKLQKELDALSEKIELKKEKKKDFETTKSAFLAKMEQINKDIGISPDIFMERFESLKKESSSLSLKIEEIEEKAKKAEKEYETIKKEKEKAESEIEKRRKNLDIAKNNFENKLTEKGFKNIEDYFSALIEEKEYKELDRDLREFERKYEIVKNNLKTLKEKLTGAKKPNISEFKNKKEKAEEEKITAEKNLAKIEKNIEETEKYISMIESALKELSGLEAEYELSKKLSDMVSGNNPHKLSLQRYVLSAFFEEVLYYASKRLYEITSRFELERKKGGDKRLALGLDINVFDTYTSQLRDVYTLSGGESFLASLSLALGLSDVVQSYSGGISMESVFIDEGFGSLDSSILDGCLKVIENLSKDGRVVGIISHVDEIKNRITSKIEVIPSKQGSGIKIYY
ncbi:MAG: SMC family ATPase [Elusimicrobiota bacterium]